MVNLILVILSIGLTAALIAATMNFMPFWANDVGTTRNSVAASLERLETAYQLAAAADELPAPGYYPGASLVDSFTQARLPFVPAAPAGYTWSFTKAALPGQLDHFCLEPSGASGLSRGQYKGIAQLRDRTGVNQLLAGSTCGAGITPPIDQLSYPTTVVFTYRVAYVEAP